MASIVSVLLSGRAVSGPVIVSVRENEACMMSGWDKITSVGCEMSSLTRWIPLLSSCLGVCMKHLESSQKNPCDHFHTIQLETNGNNPNHCNCEQNGLITPGSTAYQVIVLTLIEDTSPALT